MPGTYLNHSLRGLGFALFLCLQATCADTKTTSTPPPPAEYVEAQTYFWNAPRHATRVLVDVNQNPKRSKIWHVVDDLEWRSSVLFGRPDLYKGSKGVIIMVPGMGGNVARYGIAFSTKKFAEISLKLNFYPVAVQNRVYQGALDPTLSHDDRWNMVKDLLDLNLDLREHYQMIDRVTADPIEQGKETYLYGRSNGTGKILEMLQMYQCMIQ